VLIIPSGTYMVVITIEGNVDTNGNGFYDAGDQYISVTALQASIHKCPRRDLFVGKEGALRGVFERRYLHQRD